MSDDPACETSQRRLMAFTTIAGITMHSFIPNKEHLSMNIISVVIVGLDCESACGGLRINEAIV